MTDAESPSTSIVLERILEATPDLVWQMWTEPDHLAAWYGPAGATVVIGRLDVRVGGDRLVGMLVDAPSGPRQMWFVGVFLEVRDHVRLVYTESLSDAGGRVLSAAEMGLPAGHPVTTEVVVELEDLGGRTRLTLTHVGVPSGSPGAAGWRTALDQLVIHLAARPLR